MADNRADDPAPGDSSGHVHKWWICLTLSLGTLSVGLSADPRLSGNFHHHLVDLHSVRDLGFFLRIPENRGSRA
jgi:hypothetical protein